ncbi:MAG TPA: NAD-dependent epimerase/dehydratase family protein [Verrucomicrobiae bacterium]|nr:NAD-dependent epimerase/dehydratase family protein [Verrucomicrobiae bacterium]
MSNGFWQDRSVLITGATGLLGGWLTKRLLTHGASVTAVVRDWVPQAEIVRKGVLEHVNVARGDVTDQEFVERVLGEYEVQTVFHLAAQTVVGIANVNPVSTLESNVRGTWSVLEACRRSPRVQAIVTASSDKAYGAQPVLPYSENMPLQGRHPYDVSKSCADLIAQSYAHTFNLPVAITRCGNFYGGGDLNWNRIVPGTIRSVLRNERPVIRSDGKFVRDYLYVEDGSAAYMLLAEHLTKDPGLRGSAFNFSTETPITVLELANKILEKMGSGLKPEVRNEANYEIREQFLSAKLARERLRWKPEFALDEGLKRAITWYEELLK